MAAHPSTVMNRARNFELVGGHPALDLVNTLDWRFREGGAEELLDSYDNLLRFTEQSGLLNSNQVRRLLRSVGDRAAGQVLKAARELREAAAEVFYAALDRHSASPASVLALERAYKTASQHRTLLCSESGLQWVWPNDSITPELPVWLLSLSTVELATSDKLQPMRECHDPQCRWLFLDTSKNHTRRWCDMKVCGNRMKARRFKAQREG